jgi:hypothetical protein
VSRRGAVRREWLVLAGVLVPFSMLMAVGLHDTATSSNVPSPGAQVVNAPPMEIPDATSPPVAAAPAVDAAVSVGLEADAGVLEDTPRELEAALAALRPAVRQCFDDARAHAPARVELRVRFTAKPDGRFGDYHLESRSWQDPYFEACVEDVFDEVTYLPSGREPRGAVTHTFVLGER